MTQRPEILKQLEFLQDVSEMSRIDGDAQAKKEADKNAAEVFARLMSSAAAANKEK